METPAIAKILLVFAGMLALTRARCPLGLALLLGGVGLDAWSGRGAAVVAQDLAASMVRGDVWLLMLITAVIIELSRFISSDRNAATIMAAARRWGGQHGRAASLMVIPAVIGMVPVPGGALFSAPFVAQMTREERWTPEWRTTTNYWFRHVWEYWWPLYPVTIVTLSIFDLETWKYVAAQLPLTGAAFLAGYLILVRPHLDALREEETTEDGPGRISLILAPLVIVIAGAILLPGALKMAVPSLGSQMSKLFGMLAGLVLGLAFVHLSTPREHRQRFFSDFFTRKTMSVLFSLGGVLVFKSMMEASGLLPLAAQDLLASGIPVALVIAVLPFIAGLVTGLAMGFAGTSFPLVAGMIQADPAGLPVLPTVVLAFTCGYAGMMLSPVHLCLVVTRDYFSAAFRRVYPQLVPCVFVVMACGIVLHLILRWWL